MLYVCVYLLVPLLIIFVMDLARQLVMAVGRALLG